MRNLGKRFAAQIAYLMTVEGEDQTEEEDDWEEIENNKEDDPETKEVIERGIAKVQQAYEVNKDVTTDIVPKIELGMRILENMLNRQKDDTLNHLRLDEALQKNWGIREVLKYGEKCTHDFAGICTALGVGGCNNLEPLLAGTDNNKEKFTATIFVKNGKSMDAAIGAFRTCGQDITNAAPSRDNITFWYSDKRRAAYMQQKLETWYMMDPDWWDRLRITPYST